jgi:hypothetical protein
VTVAKTAQRQLAEDGLGDYWTSTTAERRKSRGPAPRSPSPAKPGQGPSSSELELDEYYDDEEVAQVGGGWLVNKVVLACLIYGLAALLVQAAVREGGLSAAQTAVFVGWGALGGAMSTLWAKLLGWATEDLEVGTRRTLITVAVDQLIMGTPLARACAPLYWGPPVGASAGARACDWRARECWSRARIPRCRLNRRASACDPPPLFSIPSLPPCPALQRPRWL